jgi:hypothetical protein
MTFHRELKAELDGLVGAVLACVAVMPVGQLRTLLLVDCRMVQELVEHALELGDSEADEVYRAMREAHVAAVTLGQGLLSAGALTIPREVRATVEAAQRALMSFLSVLGIRVSAADRVMQLVMLDGLSVDAAVAAIERDAR